MMRGKDHERNSIKNIRSANTVTSMIIGMVVSLTLLMSSPGAASAQELFALSTESGLEFYQVEKLKRPDLLIHTDHTLIWAKTPTENVSDGPIRSAYRTIGKPLMVKSGLQTTPNGRLTMVGTVDWQPSVEDTHKEKFIASLLPGQTENNFRRQ